MLLDIRFQHRFTVFFDYACQNISRKQDKGGVNSDDVILLKQIFTDNFPLYKPVSHIPETVKFIKFNIIWGKNVISKKFQCPERDLSIHKATTGLEVFHLFRTVSIKQLWQVNRTLGEKLVGQNKDRKITQQLQTLLVENYLNSLFIKNRAR